VLFRSAIIEAGRPGGNIDQRLLKVPETFAASGMSEAIPSDGGFLVEPTFAGELFRRSYEVGAVASRCRRFPVGVNSNGIKLPYVDETSRATGSRWGGIRVYRANEADTVAATKPKIGKLEINLEKLMGLCYITEEMMQDASQLDAYVRDGFSEEIAWALDNEIINGNGAGQCLGILNSAALVTVSKESGQTAATIIKANIDKMWSRCWARSRRNAAWFINQDIEPQLYSLVELVGTGGVPVYLPATGMSGNPYSTLYGRPVIPIEQCATLGTKGDIILADMSQFLLADKSMRTDVSMHVRFIYDELCFRITYRVNGQPLWKTSLTPANGSNTLSPFVTLEARA